MNRINMRSISVFEIILILTPFIYGYIANSQIFFIPPLYSQIFFGVYWLWVGMVFSNNSSGTSKSFLMANSLWLLSFLLFIWQFFILDDHERSISLAAISQHYMLPFVWGVERIARLFFQTINGTLVMFFAYILMIIVFSIGFFGGKINTSK